MYVDDHSMGQIAACESIDQLRAMWNQASTVQ